MAALAASQGATGGAQQPIRERPRDDAKAVGDYKHDTSPRVRDIPPKPYKGKTEHEANRNPKPAPQHQDAPDTAVQATLSAPAMPASQGSFDGISYPDSACNCAPPDTDGEVGRTQYTQIVNMGYQVFDKSGTSLLGPIAIDTLWDGFGGVCEFDASGDPVVLYDQLADRWVISQFAGTSVPTDECIAVSTTEDATGSFHRYAFHLGSNFFDYPKLAVWPDAYYMAMNVFNSSGTSFLGPQPFAFNRDAMLNGAPATFITTGITGGSLEETYLPSDLDGSTLPPAGAPNSFVEFPMGGFYNIWHFHVDFANSANSSFTKFASVPVAGFSLLCGGTSSCVPQSSTTSRLDGLADRLMFRAAYRNFGDHESVVANYSVASGGVAGVRWLELRNVTNGPVTKFQESTYQPDTTWRWMGSAAMDGTGNLAVGFSASSGSIFPQLRYAGRLVSDPLNVLAQGETVLHAGTGSQTGTYNRWGDYSALTIDPVDDCTFWFTSEYYSTTGSFNWRTRVGSFKFPSCGSSLGTLTGTVRDASTSALISGATVQVAGGSSATTNGAGVYTIDVPPATYDVTFSKAGYVSKTVNGVVVNTGSTTTLDAALDASPPFSANPVITTANACQTYAGGGALPLATVGYTVKGNKINSVTPAAFFYWVSVPAVAGSNTFVMPQQITSGSFNTQFQRSTSNVFSSACSSSGLLPSFTQTSTNGTASTVTVKFQAPAAGTYYVGLQFNTQNLRNKTKPGTNTVHYDFSTNNVAGSTAGVDLVKQ